MEDKDDHKSKKGKKKLIVFLMAFVTVSFVIWAFVNYKIGPIVCSIWGNSYCSFNMPPPTSIHRYTELGNSSGVD